MKSLFMRSTALFAAGVLVSGGGAILAADSAQAQARKPKITVNGFHKQEVGFATQKNDDAVGDTATFDVQSDSEIHFKFKYKLDNGVTLDGRWELEGDGAAGVPAGATDVIDEVYMRISGKFGMLILGSENAVAHEMSFDPRNVGLSIGDMNEWVSFAPLSNISSSGDSPLEDEDLRMEDNDSEKVSYITPKFSGIQLGVSYIPNAEQDMNGSIASTDSKSRTDTGSVYGNGLSIAGTYQRKMGKVKLALSAGWQTWFDTPMFDDGSFGHTGENPTGMVFTGSIGFGAFTLRGGFVRIQNLFDNAGRQAKDSNDGDGITLGGHYKAGRTEYSLVWHSGEDEGDPTKPGINESDLFQLSARHTVAPGVRGYVTALYADWRGEDPGEADDNKGWGLVTGLRMDF